MRNIKIPNLFVIGAMKSGTTYLHDLLSSHSDIFMSSVKEPCYFVDGAELKKLAPQMWNMGIWKSRERYEQLFEKVDSESIVGESTTLYAKYPTLSGVPERIHQFNPNARFIYVMRDPVERTISHYWHNVKVTAVMEDVLPALKSNPHYTHVSYYAMQIREYLKYFDQDRFFFCTFEELIGNSETVVREIYEWLGIDSNVPITGLNEPKNVTPVIMKAARVNFISYNLRHSPLLEMILKVVPYSVQERVSNMLTRPVEKTASDLTDVVDYLRPIQVKQTEELEELLGRKFPEWTTLNNPK